ncbi:MAG: RDD family protein [Bacteroidota bacterium]
MQTIRITTSQNIDIDYEIAGLGERMLAWLIDAAIFFVVFIAVAIISSLSGGNFRNTNVIVLVVIYAVLYVFYDLLCEIFMNGQSVGKRTMKIKVISLDGGQANIGQYLLRWVFRIVDFTLTSGTCALISVAVSNKSQRVGDMVAGTTLIRTVARTQFDALAFAPAQQEYIPVFNEVTQLTDKDIVLVHEVLTSYIKSGNTVIVYNTVMKLKQLLNINTQMDDMQFLQTIVRDYNHIAAATDAV